MKSCNTWGFSYGSAGKEAACSVGDLGSIPELGRSLGKGKGYPLQYSSLENSMDCIVHGVTKSWTGLSHFQSHALHGLFVGFFWLLSFSIILSRSTHAVVHISNAYLFMVVYYCTI